MGVQADPEGDRACRVEATWWRGQPWQGLLVELSLHIVHHAHTPPSCSSRRCTSSHSNLPDNVHQASSLSTALSLLSGEGPISTNLHRVFIIGGSQLYRSALDSESPSRTATATADRILLTRIVRGDEKWECDTFFPELDEQEWRQASHEEHQEWLQGLHVPEGLVEEGDVGWRYEMWVRK